MNMKNKLLSGKWKRWTALLMVVVMIFLQPCTVLADAGIWGKETVSGKDERKQIQEDVSKSSGDIGKESPETASDEKQEIPLYEKQEELPEEDFEILSEAETELSTEELSETGDSAGIETEESTEEGLTESETEQRVLMDFETEVLDETDSAIIQEAETEIAEDTFSQKQISEKKYTVTFFADNIVVDTQIVEEGGTAEEPEVPQKPGYTFIGWSGDYTRVTSDRNLYASYIQGENITYRVDFLDYNSRPLRNAQFIVAGGNATRPASPVRDGYTFVGWDENWFQIGKNKVIRAKYRIGEYKTYQLQYYGRSNNNPVSHILKEEWIVEGEDGTPPELETNDDYTFAGWDKGKLYTNIMENSTIYAYYYPGKCKTHKVEFVDYDGKTLMNPQYVKEGEDAPKPLDPVREGYTFTGWEGNRFEIRKAVKATAQYRLGKHKTYQLQYYGRSNNNPVSHILKEECVVEGEDGIPPVLETNDAYTFAGWDKGKLYTNVKENRTIVAYYYPGKCKTYKVEFVDYDGKALMNPQYVKEGEDAPKPLDPVREGYTFTGWGGNRFEIRKAVKATAQYRLGKHKTYQLQYYGRSNNNPVSHILKEEWVVEGEDGIPPELETNDAYTFAGWDKEKLYTNVKENRTIAAYYYTGKYATHKVEFIDYNGKYLINPQYIIDGNAMDSPASPYRDGYTFTGWDKEFYRITAPVMIQALYKEGNYTTYPVSFYGKITGNPNWQLLKKEYVPAGEEAHPPKLPINAGYTFREWSGNITGIQSSQNVYAQYDKNEETETTYTVRFWCRGEVIKTEEVAVGGNATPPPVPGVKGYSFAGWDKSYVNINPGTRSMAVDITAQYQLTSGIQNAGSLTDLANALMALGVPVAVKNGFAALGAAIINPFDGIILDVLAATALVATIIYYWDDIKGLWEDIKTVFQNFAGMDAAGEILGNIEAGVDEAGKDDADAIALGLSGIAGQYGVFKCKEAADAMADYLKKQKQKFKFITMKYPSKPGTIISLSREALLGDYNKAIISENGLHYGIEYNGIVYCNIHPLGLPRSAWEADFWGPGQEFREITPP